jgi:nucleoside-diphosphate-sugar epimerase
MSTINRSINKDRTARTMIVGNLGYIGPVLTAFLRKEHRDTSLVGYDTGYFSGCLLDPLTPVDHLLDFQIHADVRSVRAEHLIGIDQVIYLAAISNDPMGNLYEGPTEEINSAAAARFADLARRAGARRFVYASSCSIYGAGGAEMKSEHSTINPLTAYARSKVSCEQALQPSADRDFVVTCLRFATACGASPRLRLDLVLNDFVASALLTDEIKILSDGAPWRPLIDVEDMCRAIAWALTRDASQGGAHLAVNVGYNDQNYTIRDLAYAVQEQLPTASVNINTAAPADKRSYRVDFSLYASLNAQAKSGKPLAQTVRELVDSIQASDFRTSAFRTSYLVRLQALSMLRQRGRLDSALRWT